MATATVARVHEGRAMGTDLRLVLVGAMRAAVERALAHVADLEGRWSRFRPDAELTRLGRAGGAPVVVSAPTARLVAAMVEAWQVTGGLVDASVLPAVEAAGYDRTFASLPPIDPALAVLGAPTRAGARVPGLAGVEVDGTTVRLPPGVRLDPGALGKGMAADLVATTLLADGWVRGALVSLGGDLRVVGEAPDAAGWSVALDAPAGTGVVVPGGGLATSSTRRRRWAAPDGGVAHHVVDPRTGRPATTPRTDATAVAPQAWQAEALATATLLAGPGDPAVEAAADAWAGASLALDGRGELTVHDTMEVLLW